MAIWGCIADDFTGASDAASFLRKGGMKVRLFNGVPKKTQNCEADDAWVIALKTRTEERTQAVRHILEAYDFLRENRIGHIYIKYCSTFDSTREGNIGPGVDSVMEKMKQKFTILCPALPVNGRTVKDGILYVNQVPLAQSPMKDHPLTPMWDSRIVCLMESQSKYSCMILSKDDMEQGKTEEKIEAFGKNKEHFYVIPDFEEMSDAKRLTELFGRLPLLTGGSGLLEELAVMWTAKSDPKPMTAPPQINGKALLLAGSCSTMTRRQIQDYQKHGGICLKVNPVSLYKKEMTVEDIWNEIQNMGDSDVLVYTSDTPKAVAVCQSYGQEEIAGMIEGMFASLAKKAVQNGYKRIITAGGETSGAVTKALGFDDFYIGESIAPGVPIMVPAPCPDIKLVLKSGNFGQEDFFRKALEQTGEGL